MSAISMGSGVPGLVPGQEPGQDGAQALPVAVGDWLEEVLVARLERLVDVGES